MRQILQNLGTGETMLAEVPAPGVRAGSLLIETRVSLISLGTERMLVDFGRAGWLEKARQQPEKVKQVLRKVKTDGLKPTLEVVRARLDQPLPLGYSNVGRVVEVGPGVAGFSVGDRVLSNGAHAEVVCVPKNLCAKVPEGVSDEEAAFGVVSAIGLQGIRLLAPTLGENFVVVGLGLIGLLAAQMLRAHGCRVLGADLDSAKVAMARELGAEAVCIAGGGELAAAAETFTGGVGADGVLITASTKSSAPVNQAAEVCRKKGRIVQVGATGLRIDRTPFYEKELSFQVSCSYGPGRYDADYEERGIDYPLPYVRWTEQRNFEAVLGMMAEGTLRPRPLVTHRFRFADAVDAYGNVSGGKALGMVLVYEGESPEAGVAEERGAGAGKRGTGDRERNRVVALEGGVRTAVPEVVCGVIGAGNFTGLVLLPALKATGARLRTIVSANGVSAAHNGKKFGFEQAASDARAVFDDPEVNTVFITTRHGSHARYVIEALRAGKHVFVEKPLCLTEAELAEIEAVYRGEETGGTPALRDRQDAGAPCGENTATPLLMVGFNRRFSPYVVKMKELLEGMQAPVCIDYMVNAGPVPADHWMHDPEAGGGRIIGEGCHFIDLCRYLAGVEITECRASYLGGPAGAKGDVASVQMEFADGSIATVHYWANGTKAFPKERIEAFCGGGVLQLDNFRKLRGYGWPGFSKFKAGSQDKGHKEEIRRFVEAVRTGGESPIPAREIFEVTRATLAVGHS